ncbi:Pro-resilin [Papilio xuthus]|uniref:Pro-resilin n=1 Tax=Papilio xuthus TaxID=66420 RepID=A0A194QCM4_PAPXU|nr:Pro-resilin [Papilio xuthus]
MAPLTSKLVTAILLLTIQITTSVKSNSRPVYEVINEQSKAEERQIKTSAVANLPYGNPLADNSQQNAKLHAYNQQAMFNAERVRQHKAQIQQQQRWLKTPQLVHNYMRAYHESEENHQLALEKEQAKNDTKETKQPTKDTIKLETVKERKRKHRSYGSIAYQTTNIPDNIVLNPNIINKMVIIPKLIQPQYDTHSHQSVRDIETLNSLLNKNPNVQLTEFNALINKPKININNDKELETPIDLYYHLKPSKSFIHTHKGNIIIKEETEFQTEEPRYNEAVTKEINYINKELINTDYVPLYEEDKTKEVEEQRYQLYEPIYNHKEDKTEELNEIYLNKGIRHLNKNGSRMSAYDENLNYASSYEFGYRVRDMHSGNNFGHQEEKKGEETNGQYHVLLPDGRMQNVRYSAGPEGFHADISYDH